MLQLRKDRVEWCGEYLLISSKIIIPAVVLNSCASRVVPPVRENDIPRRGLAFYNPGGEQGRPDTICLVLAPNEGNVAKRSSGKGTQFQPNPDVIRSDLFSSYQRLNMLRGILHLYPFYSKLDGFGALGKYLKQFRYRDKEKHQVAFPDETIVGLCPIDPKDSTIQVLLNMYPAHMRSLFELKCRIQPICTCGETEPDQHVAITCIDIDCSGKSGAAQEKRFLDFFRRMQKPCCSKCRYQYEIQNTPPILSVVWNQGSAKNEFQRPGLDLSLSNVFKSGCSDDLRYQLVTVCSKKGGKLWSAHCKSYKTGLWKTIEHKDCIRVNNWADTCKLWNHESQLQLLYLQTCSVPGTSDSPLCLSEGSWVLAKYNGTEALYPAQIDEVFRIPNEEIKFHINWDDNDMTDRVKQAKDLYPLLDVIDKVTKFQIGDRVMAGFGRSMDETYPAVIVRCFEGLLYLVSWDDGDQIFRVRKEGVLELLRETHRNTNSTDPEHGCNGTVADVAETTTASGQFQLNSTEGGSQTRYSNTETEPASHDTEIDLIKRRNSRCISRSKALLSSDEDNDDLVEGSTQAHPASPDLSNTTPAGEVPNSSKLNGQAVRGARMLRRCNKSSSSSEPDPQQEGDVSV